MKVAAELCNFLFVTFCFVLISGLQLHSIPYDHFATTECLKEPRRALYGGGIITNSDFDQNTKDWTVFGNGTIKIQKSNDGNNFIVASNRTHTLDSFSQKVQLKKGMQYTVSAWFQLGKGSADDIVSAVFKINGSELAPCGYVIAKHGCWSFLKGGIVANFSSSAEILFQTDNPTVELWADSVSVQPFTVEQWRSHQDSSIEKVRKSKVRFRITHLNETTMEGAKIVIKQTKPKFPFGCAMNGHILTNIEYQKWFVSRFKYTTFTNEMKWYSTESIQGQENYTISDGMMKFAKDNNISVRGHSIFWADFKFQPQWVKTLPRNELRKASAKRLNSVVSRYRGQVIAWDVMNENIHYHFYEDTLGGTTDAEYYSSTYHLDPKATLFLNEFNTIEYTRETVASPANYIRKLKEIQQFPGTAGMPLAIGLQGHFGKGAPSLSYMRSGLDLLGATGLPIWLTETSVEAQPNQEVYLEQVLREGYSHPAVQGIILFLGPAQAGFVYSLLADMNFRNTPSGDVVDKLIKEWETGPKTVIADSRGIVDISLHHGDYEVTVTHPLTQNSKKLNLSVRKGFSPDTNTILVKMNA